MLNEGKASSDEFEMEILVFAEKIAKSNSQLIKKQAAALGSSVKKEGGAMIKAVKTNVNPAVKQAVKSVKSGSKSAYKGVKSKMRTDGSIHGGHSASSLTLAGMKMGRAGTVSNNRLQVRKKNQFCLVRTL